MKLYIRKELTGRNISKNVELCIKSIEGTTDMILDENDFIQNVDKDFWKKITEKMAFKDVVNYKDLEHREFLRKTAREINDFSHNFLKPNYYYSPKEKGVLRKVKSYSIADIAIFYYCVKKIQDELTKQIKRNEMVYGGFKFTHSNKVLANNEVDIVEIPIEYESFLSRRNAIIEWKEFHHLARKASQRNFDRYIHIDISHFYDDINLDVLEINVRNVVVDKSNIIDLLFYFLRYSDKRDLGYTASNVGIPQEEIGDMSRVLANFYLSSFDTEILAYLSTEFENDDYHYMRYSDDMWICINGDDDDAYRIIQHASLFLEKIKLHINEKKTKILNRVQFSRHWHFSKWEKILKNRYNVIEAKHEYDKIMMKANNSGRWTSIANYSLKVITSSSINAWLYSFGQATIFIDFLLNHPKMIEKLDNKNFGFFVMLLSQHNTLINYLIKYLKSKKNIYPNVEFFILKILTLLPSDLAGYDIVGFIVNYYRKYTKREFQWYSRCICLKFLIDNVDITNTRRVRRVLKHIAKMTVDTEIEKRYIIKYLHAVDDHNSKKILFGDYLKSFDVRFVIYLNNN